MPLRRADRGDPLPAGNAKVRELTEFLKQIIDDHRQSYRRLEKPMRMGRSAISARLNDGRRPDWKFVKELVRACTEHDPNAQEILLKKARKKWEAANPSLSTDPAHSEHPGPGEDESEDGGATGDEPASSTETPARRRPAIPSPGEVWGTPPDRTACFTGRKDQLQELRAGFETHDVQVITGLFGTGKTQLALKYVDRFRSAYAVVIWLPADEPGMLRSSLAALAPRLGLEPADQVRLEDTVQDVLGALSEIGRRSCPLLVYDNADRPERIRHLIPPHGGQVLITSRDPAWSGFRDDGVSIPLPTFTRDESRLLLGELLQDEHPPALVARLAERLGDHPLALTQAASLINDLAMDIPEYLASLSAGAGSVLSDGDPAPYPMSMRTAWALAAGLLRERSFDALCLLRHCAALSAGPIPVADLNRPDEIEGMDARTAALVADPLRLRTALAEIGRMGLARFDTTTRTIEIHALTRALALDESPD